MMCVITNETEKSNIKNDCLIERPGYIIKTTHHN